MTLDKLSQITEVGIKSGITLRNINVEGAYVSGVVTATTLTITDGFSVSGVVTASSFDGNVTGTINPTSLNVSGVSTFGANIFLGDGDAAYFGDGQDLLIFHNSTDSIIRDNGTGDLFIEGGNVIRMTNPTGIETYATFNQDAAVELYYDGTKKFETTSAGVNVTGTAGVGTALFVNGDARITGILTVGTASITFNGNDNSVTIGTGVTVFGNTGIVSATEFRGNGANLTGVGAFVAGTLMLFQQTAAPTGWTKQTTHNDKTLRVVSGTASSGGSTAFTSVFASRTPSGSVSGSNSGGSVSNTTLTTTTMPSHVHYADNSNAFGSTFGTWAYAERGGAINASNDNYVKATGSSSAHGHGFTNPTWSGTFSGSAMDFAVQYVDLIIASKD